MVVLVLVGGGPSARAAISPQPYLDPSFGTAFWNDVLGRWPSGYPDSALDPDTFGVSVAAGALPTIASGYGTISVPTGTFDSGWKINRSIDTVWLHLHGNVGTQVTTHGSIAIEGEQWCNYSTLCDGWIGSPATGSKNHDMYLGMSFAGCLLFNNNQGTITFFSDSGFDRSTPSSYIACNDAINSAYTTFAETAPGAEFPQSSTYCNGAANSFFGSHWSAANGGTCFARIWKEASIDALVASSAVPYTNQGVNQITTIPAPSNTSANVSAAQTQVTNDGCPAENEYNGAEDPPNWTRPNISAGSCGGAKALPNSQSYGPPGSSACWWVPSGHPDFSPAAENPTCVGGEPVDLATGNFYTSSVDIALQGFGIPFTFERSYNSLDTTSGQIGYGWTDNLNWSVGGTTTAPILRTGTGQQLQFSLGGPGGNVVGVFSTPGGRIRLSGAAGAGWTAVTRDMRTYTFDGTGRLTSVVDRNGKGLTLAYDAGGNVSSVTDAAGRQITFTTSGGEITKITLPDGRSVSYGYNGGLLTSFTDLDGGTTTYSYDDLNRLQSITDANNHQVVSNAYDPNGRVSQQTDARGHVSNFDWNSTTDVATYTDANGHAWTQTYKNNLLQSVSDPLGNTTSFTYDGDLNVASITDPRDKTTSMTWGSNGDLMSRTAPAPLSYTQSWTYDGFNDVTSYKDGRGHTSNYGYDSKGNLTSIALPGGQTTTFGRDPATGLVTSITDPRSKTTTFGYDGVGDLTSVTTPLGHETTFGYDASGRLTSATDALQNTTTYTYDNANRLIAETDPLGDKTQWAYDPVGNLTGFTDANNNTWTYAYDSSNDLSTVTAPDTSVTSYSYDDNGNLTSKTDANNHTTTYGYDNANRLTSLVKPGGETWTYSYDPDGDLTGVVDGNNATTTYGYDALDRLTSIAYSGTVTPNVGFTYDGDGNRAAMTDGAGTVDYTYDSDNRLTGVTRGSQEFTYGYDANSNLTSETYPDSTAITYAYTDDEQLASVSAAGNTTSYSYDPAGDLTTTTLPAANGYSQSLSYDKAGRLTGVSNANAAGTLSAFAYTLDAVGNPLEVDQTGTTTSTTTYGYDSLDRLTSATVNGASTSWTYDGVGNRLTQTSPDGTTDYTYNADDELTAAGPTSYGYDGNGNQTAAGADTFGYDVANRMLSADIAGTTSTYGYDGDGLRLSSTTGGSATDFLWDPAAALPQLDIEQTGSGTEMRSYLYGLGLVSMASGGSTFYYHSDGLGSTADLTDASGNPQWSYSYDAWGNPSATLDTEGAPANPIQYAGGYTDPNGLSLFGHREYDPTSGRFLTTDPANLAAGSTYAYVDDQPTYWTDPSGLGWGWGGSILSGIGSAFDNFISGAENDIGAGENAIYQFTQQRCLTKPILFAGVGVLTDGLGDALLAGDLSAEATAGAAAEESAVAGGSADLDALSTSGRDAAKGGLTRAGRSYAKHMGRGELPRVPNSDLNSAGQDLLDEILTHPGTTQTDIGTGNFAGGSRFVSPNGVGATFDANGAFRYFGQYP